MKRRLRELVADPASAGLHWSIDPDTPEPEREQAHVTAATVAHYLQTHKAPPAKTAGPEFLLADPARSTFYVRWPNGALRWESAVSLHARAITIPRRMILSGTSRA